MAEVLTFQVDDAQIIFRNFSGKEDKYNREGDRNFSVILDEEAAQRMLADGWNVKYLAAREEGDDDTPYIQVAVGYKNRPPRVVLISSAGRTNLDEDNVETLDWVSIRKADLIARAYQWEVNGKGGIKAYLQTMFVTIEEDELERRYAVKED
jgi:hypothetical protein